MNPREKIYTFYFQNGHSFPDEIVMRDTLRAEFMRHEIHVPSNQFYYEKNLAQGQ